MSDGSPAPTNWLIWRRDRRDEARRIATNARHCRPLTKQSSVMTDTSDSIPATATKIEINLSRLPQLFNSLDPSPFLERDLDRDAEDYIVGSAEEAPRQHPLALVIHLPADQLPAQGLPNLREAIHNYFAYRRDQEDRRLRLLFRDGRIALLIGLGFLFCCVLLRELANSFGNEPRIFSERVC